LAGPELLLHGVVMVRRWRDVALTAGIEGEGPGRACCELIPLWRLSRKPWSVRSV
jgi:hypothetical protein